MGAAPADPGTQGVLRRLYRIPPALHSCHMLVVSEPSGLDRSMHGSIIPYDHFLARNPHSTSLYDPK